VAADGSTHLCRAVLKAHVGWRRACVARTLSSPPIAPPRARTTCESPVKLGALRALRALGALGAKPLQRLCSDLPG
jgi:hypothetical protein